MKKNNLVNQTAIVCGASKGIGAATAIGFQNVAPQQYCWLETKKI